MTLSNTKPAYGSLTSVPFQPMAHVRGTFLLSPGAEGAGHAFEIDAHELLNTAVRQCRKSIEARRLHVTLRLLAKRFRIRTDPDRLLRVFLNLLTTNIQKTAPDGRITIRSSCADGDTGSLRVEIEETSAWQLGPDPDDGDGEEAHALRSINR